MGSSCSFTCKEKEDVGNFMTKVALCEGYAPPLSNGLLV